MIHRQFASRLDHINPVILRQQKQIDKEAKKAAKEGREPGIPKLIAKQMRKIAEGEKAAKEEEEEMIRKMESLGKEATEEDVENFRRRACDY